MTDSAPLKVVFAGTPEFAGASLEALLTRTAHQVLAVLTQPDRPAGRGKKLTPSPVKVLAQDHGIPVWQPENLKGDDIVARLEALAPDVMVVVAYGLIIPRRILDLPRFGCINVHGSLLPRWRGAAPIQRAIAAGDEETGVGIMQMEAGLDTGPVLLETRCPIGPDDTGGTVHDRLAALGADALVEALSRLPELQASARPQPDQGVTYAHKLSKDDARLDFRLSAAELAQRVRAFDPWPVAWLPWQGQPLRVWAATAVAGTGAPGEVLAVAPQGIDIACGDGALRLEEIQLPGKKRMSVADSLRGHPDLLAVGERLD